VKKVNELVSHSDLTTHHI